jgi:hypothetical protein
MHFIMLRPTDPSATPQLRANFRVHLQHPAYRPLLRLADSSLPPISDLATGDEPIELELVSRAKGKDPHHEKIEYHPKA